MILAIGDSNLYPSCTESGETVDLDNMGPVFARLMDQPYRCWGKNGASNYWIENHIQYFLADNTWDPKTFLFIGWTSYEREEWPWLYSNYSVCGGPSFGLPDPLKARFEQWKLTLTEDYRLSCLDKWHDKIYTVHEQLLNKQIPHLFWTTYDNFKDIKNHKRNWHGNFYRPYDTDGCMVKWFDMNNISPKENDIFHYDRNAHAMWAQELAVYAQENLLFK